MKKLLIVSLVAAALGVSTSAFAQAAGPAGGAPKAPLAGGPGPGRGRMKEMEKLNEEILGKLNLTDDQKAKIATHRNENAAKVLELRKSAKVAGNANAAREQMKAIRKENQAFMKQTLTKDQLKEYMRLRREAMKEIAAKNGAGTPVKP